MRVELSPFQKSVDRGSRASRDAIAIPTRIKVRTSAEEWDTYIKSELAQTIGRGQTIALPREASVRIYTVVSITLIK